MFKKCPCGLLHYQSFREFGAGKRGYLMVSADNECNRWKATDTDSHWEQRCWQHLQSSRIKCSKWIRTAVSTIGLYDPFIQTLPTPVRRPVVLRDDDNVSTLTMAIIYANANVMANAYFFTFNQFKLHNINVNNCILTINFILHPH